MISYMTMLIVQNYITNIKAGFSRKVLTSFANGARTLPSITLWSAEKTRLQTGFA